MSILEKFVLLYDAAVVCFVVFVARKVSRALRPLPHHNYRPSDDDARSARRITLFIYPKGRKPPR